METTRKVVFWDRLSIGNPDIDKDHKKLLEIYNDLVDLIELKKMEIKIKRLLKTKKDENTETS